MVEHGSLSEAPPRLESSPEADPYQEFEVLTMQPWSPEVEEKVVYSSSRMKWICT